MKKEGFKVIAVYPELAKEIGLNESMVLETLRRELRTNYKVRDSRRWYYHALSKLHSEFLPFLSVTTIGRAIASLESRKLIEVGAFNEMQGDRTQWFSINVEECKKLKSATIFQNEKSIVQNDKWSGKPLLANMIQNEKCPDSKPTIFQNEPTIHENTPAPTVSLNSKTTISPNGEKPARKKRVSEFEKLAPEYRDAYKPLFPEVARICRVNLRTCSGRLRGEIDAAVAALAKAGATVEKLTAYEQSWYEQDWRGKKREAPTIELLRSGWDQPIGGVKGNGTETASERNIRRLRESADLFGIETSDDSQDNSESESRLQLTRS